MTPISSLFPFHDPDLLLRQAVEFVDHPVDLMVGGLDPALEDGPGLEVGDYTSTRKMLIVE